MHWVAQGGFGGKSEQRLAGKCLNAVYTKGTWFASVLSTKECSKSAMWMREETSKRPRDRVSGGTHGRGGFSPRKRPSRVCMDLPDALVHFRARATRDTGRVDEKRDKGT